MASLHDSFGPSSLFRRHMCPASAIEEASLPDKHSDEAEYGTMMHAWIAAYLSSGVMPQEAGECNADIILRAADSVSEILGDGYGERFVENRMELPHWSGPITFGTCDLMVVPAMLPDTVYIVDWKFGRNQVEESESSWQLGAYSAMAMARTGRTKCLAKIVQPLVKGGLQNPWQVFENLPDLTAKIRRVKISCQPDEHPVHIPGEKQCKYCKAAMQGTCPAVNAAITQSIVKCQQIERREEIAPLSSWSDGELAVLCANIAMAENAIQTAKDELRNRLMSGHHIAGWVLEERKGVRKGDGALVWQQVQKHITPGEYMAMCTPSLPKMEKLWAERESAETGCTKKAASQAIADALEESGAVVRADSTFSIKRKD